MWATRRDGLKDIIELSAKASPETQKKVNRMMDTMLYEMNGKMIGAFSSAGIATALYRDPTTSTQNLEITALMIGLSYVGYKIGQFACNYKHKLQDNSASRT